MGVIQILTNVSCRHSSRFQRALTSVEGILLRCPSVIRYLNAGSSLGGILEEVEIRAFIKSVMRRLCCGSSIEVVDICEAVSHEDHNIVAVWGSLQGCS